MLTTTKTRVDTYLDVHVTVDKSVDVTAVGCNAVFFAKGRFVLAEHVRKGCRRKLVTSDGICLQCDGAGKSEQIGFSACDLETTEAMIGSIGVADSNLLRR